MKTWASSQFELIWLQVKASLQKSFYAGVLTEMCQRHSWRKALRAWTLSSQPRDLCTFGKHKKIALPEQLFKCYNAGERLEIHKNPTRLKLCCLFFFPEKLAWHVCVLTTSFFPFLKSVLHILIVGKRIDRKPCYIRKLSLHFLFRLPYFWLHQDILERFLAAIFGVLTWGCVEKLSRQLHLVPPC